MTPESIKQLMQKSVDEIIESIDFEKQSLSEINFILIGEKLSIQKIIKK